jgi:hypothetical protein
MIWLKNCWVGTKQHSLPHSNFRNSVKQNSCPVWLPVLCGTGTQYYQDKFYLFRTVEGRYIFFYTHLYIVFWVRMFNTTFNNISVISWRWVLLVEETRLPGENHRPATSHWQTLSQKHCWSQILVLYNLR